MLKDLKYWLFYKTVSVGRFRCRVIDVAVVPLLIVAILFINLPVLIQLGTLLIAVILHEIAHGYVALKFGDPTAKNLGRLTLNPISHMDLLGSVILPAILIFSGSSFLFGWAKPVPVQPRYFKHPIQDMMWVAIAGPLTNISIAIVASLSLKLMIAFGVQATPFSVGVAYFFQYSIIINIVLALFNLLPVPPLDGSRVLMNFLPMNGQSNLSRLEPYGFVIIMILLYLGVIDLVLGVLMPPVLAVLLPGA